MNPKNKRELNKTYRVIFWGAFEPSAHFERNMIKIGVSSETVHLMIHKAPVILRGGLTLADAKLYASAVLGAGGNISIQEIGLENNAGRLNKMVDIHPFSNFIRCPECGHKQIRGERCEKCGYSFLEKG